MRRLGVLLVLALFAHGSAVAQSGPDVADPEKIKQLRGEVEKIRPAVIAARQRFDAAVAAYETIRTELAQISARHVNASLRLQKVRDELGAARAAMGRRAAAMYMGGRVDLLSTLFASRSFAGFMRASTHVAAIAKADQRLVDRIEGLERYAAGVEADIAHQVKEARASTQALRDKQRAVQIEMQSVAAILNEAQQALGAEVGKFRFPLPFPYSYVDSFGAPRMIGTSYAHAHEGVDIFAPHGTSIYSVVNGTVERVGTAPLGGIKLWVRASNGWTYYYAHLSGYAPAAQEGARVDAGTVLGYVGTTGNAQGTPPHLHFEIHRPDGAAVNPYSTLREADTLWR